jgi:hypothetical protein
MCLVISLSRWWQSRRLHKVHLCLYIHSTFFTNFCLESFAKGNNLWACSSAIIGYDKGLFVPTSDVSNAFAFSTNGMVNNPSRRDLEASIDRVGGYFWVTTLELLKLLWSDNQIFEKTSCGTICPKVREFTSSDLSNNLRKACWTQIRNSQTIALKSLGDIRVVSIGKIRIRIIFL